MVWIVLFVVIIFIWDLVEEFVDFNIFNLKCFDVGFKVNFVVLKWIDMFLFYFIFELSGKFFRIILWNVWFVNDFKFYEVLIFRWIVLKNGFFRLLFDWFNVKDFLVCEISFFFVVKFLFLEMLNREFVSLLLMLNFVWLVESFVIKEFIGMIKGIINELVFLKVLLI